MPSGSAEPLSHSSFIKSRSSSLSIKQRNRDGVTLSCKREELWIFNEMAHFHRNNTFLCLVYHFQIWKKWVYLTLGSLHITALYTAQSTRGSIGRHSACCICPMKSSICSCLHYYWDAYKICLESQLGKKLQHKVQLLILTTQRNGHFHI